MVANGWMNTFLQLGLVIRILLYSQPLVSRGGIEFYFVANESKVYGKLVLFISLNYSMFLKSVVLKSVVQKSVDMPEAALQIICNNCY